MNNDSEVNPPDPIYQRQEIFLRAMYADIEEEYK
jgi:hypothetical protein